jgi:hypothetical protein
MAVRRPIVRIAGRNKELPIGDTLPGGGSGSPGGATTQIQFNNAGAFAGNANATINLATGAVTLGVDATINGVTVGRGGWGVITNTANGRSALSNNVDGEHNTASGQEALLNNISGMNNTATGSRALLNNSDGESNTASGLSALESNTTGSNNTASGLGALGSNTTGNNNIGLGHAALYYNITGSNNTAIGYFTGFGITTGSANTIIGANVNGLPANLSNTIILADGNGNQRLVINAAGNAAFSGTVTAPNIPARSTGTAIVDFGAGADSARVTVASTAVSATRPIFVTIDPAGTADHNADDHLLEDFDLRPANIIPGVSFDIVMKPRGNFNLHKTWAAVWALA